MSFSLFNSKILIDENLLRMYIVYYQYIIRHIQQINKISECFQLFFAYRYRNAPPAWQDSNDIPEKRPYRYVV